MGIKELEKYICDTIKEWQLKIGDQKEAAGFYYPEASLKSLLGISFQDGTKALHDALEVFCQEAEPRLGKVRFSHRNKRYCIAIPKEGSVYVAKEVPEPYVYCVEEDEFGLTYHRFTRADYAELFR